MIFTPAYAQGAPAPSGGLDFSFLVVLGLMMLIWYFLLIRPQQKRMREYQEMLSQLRRGDEVVTAGGLKAKITKVKEGDDEIEAEIAEGVRVRVVKGTISAVVSKTTPAEASSNQKPANSDRKPAAKK